MKNVIQMEQKPTYQYRRKVPSNVLILDQQQNSIKSPRKIDYNMILQAKREIYDSRLQTEQRSLQSINQFLQNGLNLQ
jgi:hypothetical protein